MGVMAVASCPRVHQCLHRDNGQASYKMWTYGYPIEPVCALQIDPNVEPVE